MKRDRFIPKNVKLVYEPMPEYVSDQKAQFIADILMATMGDEIRRIVGMPKMPDLSFVEDLEDDEKEKKAAASQR